MKQKISNHMKNNWQEYASVILMLFIIFIFLYFKYDLKNFKISVPISYSGGDDLSMLVDAKLFTEQNWAMETDRLGAPYGTQFYDFTANVLHNFGLFIMKLFACLTNNAAIAFNLTFLSIFFMSGLTSYIVMRNIDINCWISSFMSSVFGLSPYMFARGTGHMVLTETYFIPFSLLLCFWIMEKDDIFVFDRNFFKQPINYIILLFAFLIGNNGIGYYPFFTCFALIITGISKTIKSSNIKYIKKSLAISLFISLFMFASIIPGKIYNFYNGSNAEAISRGGFVETEYYGLKIIMLLMPRNGHRIFDRVIQYYDENTVYLNENITEYLGIIAIIGFIILMVCFFIKDNSVIGERLKILSELNIMFLLLGTVSGFGTIFAFLVSDKLRGYNRISIFIEYVCICALALAINELIKKWNNGVKGIGVYIIVFIASIFSIWEGANPIIEKSNSEIIEEYNSDEKFITYIENELSEGAMIYQLPYHIYPEGGEMNDMADYSLFVGFIHSQKLKWSYASVKGRETDEWNKDVSLMETDEMVSYLKECGFEGIYIDRRAYTEDSLTELENELENVIGNDFIVSDNGKLSFIKFY